MDYTFDGDEAMAANANWCFNCGPAALAFILQQPLTYVRDKIPDFERKRYTSPTMMMYALANCGKRFVTQRLWPMFLPVPCLARIQWCGPWTESGANPRWAYRYTHWIVTFEERYIFDINCGIVTLDEWEQSTAKAIMASIPRCNGKWEVTHLWSIEDAK